MRELRFEGVGRLRWRDVAEPELAGGLDALVRPIAAARCDLDAAWMRSSVGRTLRIGAFLHQVDRPASGDLAGWPAFAPPFPVGHECVAEVISLGSEVRSVQVGQRVVVPFQIACGACGSCNDGFSSLCDTGPLPVTTYGFGPGARMHGGVIADLVHVPYADAMLVKLPEGVDPCAAASASDNLPDAYRSVAPLLRERPGGSVLVVGGLAASVGLYAAAVAKALGASEVHYADDDRARLEIAERLGVHALELRSGRWGRLLPLPARYALSVDARSDRHARGLELALRSLAPGGICTSVGIHFGDRTPIPLMQMYRDGLTLRTGITNSRSLIPAVLDLIASGALDPAPVATLVAPWEDADRAFLERTTKVIVSRSARA
jgi:threonine dehydrogenase-like Zn-dependent dehydrogenase